MKAGNTLPHAAHGEIVKSELVAILDTVVEAKCGLWDIYQLLDKATTMSEIRARFARWQAEQRVKKMGSDTWNSSSPSPARKPSAPRNPCQV